jgi:hypothetical protein
MTTDHVEEIGRLIAALPPPPPGWVAAAQQLPRARRTLDDLVQRASADAELRSRLVADLESALSEAGIEPTRHIVAVARDRLRSS